MKVALFVDISNIFYCINKRFPKRKLDYAKLYERAQSFGDLQRAFAYGTQVSDEAVKFIRALKAMGYDTKYKNPKQIELGEKIVFRRADHDVNIAMDIVRMTNRSDIIILSSSDADLVPVVNWVHDQGVKVIILACGIARELKDAAQHWIEIDEHLLEDIKNA